MKNIANEILDFIDQTMTEKGLTLYDSTSGKYLAMDSDFNTHYKFDLSFSENAFICLVLARGDRELSLSQTFNVSWTNGRGLREFFDFIRGLKAAR